MPARHDDEKNGRQAVPMTPTASSSALALNNIPSGQLLSNKPIVLWFHDRSAFSQDIIVNPDPFPHLLHGQLLRFHFPSRNNEDNDSKKQKPQVERDVFIAKATLADREALARQQQLQISISKDIAERFNLRFRPEVYVELINPHAATLDHVELAFKEQYIGRSDMWRLQQSMFGTCVYSEKKVLYAGSIKMTVKRLWANDKEVTSGYIGESTRFIFRSASAKFFLFIQMAREMWEFDEDGELYFEKVVNNFLPQLFSRWKAEGANHVVSIVLFTRVYYSDDDPIDDFSMQSEDGRYYKDFYKVIVDWETTDDWMTIIGSLKREQLVFQPGVLMCEDQGRTIVSGQISMAYEGNILEAVNLALNPFDKHYVDRDLMRTGLSIIVITPGAGKFSVNKKLLRLTNERMTDNGIAMDLVCLSPLPLHITPLFYYRSPPPAEENYDVSARHSNKTQGLAPLTTAAGSPDVKTTNYEAGGVHRLPTGYIDPLYQDPTSGPLQVYYSVPHWIDCSFYHHETGRFLKRDKYKTRCKMYDLQMMGIMEHDIARIHIPFLSLPRQPTHTSDVTLGGRMRQQRSSGSLHEAITVSVSYGAENHGHTDVSLLSRSANFPSTHRFLPTTEIAPRSSDTSTGTALYPPLTTADFDRYDNSVFKDSEEPRFIRRYSAQSKTNSFSRKGTRPSVDSNNDRLDSSKYTTWHHSDQKRFNTMIQQAGSGSKDTQSHRKDESSLPRASEIFRGSPTMNETTLRRLKESAKEGDLGVSEDQVNEVGSADMGGKLAIAEEEDGLVVSSSTVDPVPINNKTSNRYDRRRGNTSNHSPRQNIMSGSLPSIHKHSGNSEVSFSSFTEAGLRSSPMHGWTGRGSAPKYMLINPCNPSYHTLLFTSHLRRWQHALPKVEAYDGPVVYWKSLSTPACLPLTTDYFPSDEELRVMYHHFMYTVSTSDDANLYQAGDRTLPEHTKTANLLTEMIRQRLAQGYQIIVDTAGGSYKSKTLDDAAKDAPLSGAGSGSGPSAMAIGLRGGVSKLAGDSAIMTPGTTIVGPAHQDDTSGQPWKQRPWWLSMGHQVHQLVFDPSGQNIEVRRYDRIINFDQSKTNYKCAIWPLNLSSYRPKNLSFSYPSLMAQQWNYLDHLVAGHQDELLDSLRFWRARFIVIPQEQLPSTLTLPGNIQDSLDEEEKRIALFDLWMQTVRKAKWMAPSEREELQRQQRRKEIGISDVKLTTLDPAAYLSNEALKLLASSSGSDSVQASGHNGGGSLSRESKLRDIATAMRDVKNGIKVLDRRWHFKMFRQAFIGSEFVDWLINHFDDIRTREEAVWFGNALMQRKPPLFVSSTNRHNFLDGHFFYQLHEEYSPSQQKLWFMNNVSISRKSSPALGGILKEAEGEEISGPHPATGTLSALGGSGVGAGGPSGLSTASANDLRLMSSRSSSATQNIVFDMSKSMIIDVDPNNKSDQRETAVLHYDTLHNPKNCYHFQIYWLGCTAQLVQELLQNWTRQAERCGLVVVEGSVEQAYEESENNNPFQSPVPIELAKKPPPVSDLAPLYDVSEQFYEMALIRHLGFVLDVEADAKFDRARAEGIDIRYSYNTSLYKYDQYIHHSGVSFVQIRPDHTGFYWVNNRLYTNHAPALVTSRRRAEASTPLTHPDRLRTEFMQRCNDATWLAEFWETTRHNLLQKSQSKFENTDDADAWMYEHTRALEIVEPNVQSYLQSKEKEKEKDREKEKEKEKEKENDKEKDKDKDRDKEK